MLRYFVLTRQVYNKQKIAKAAAKAPSPLTANAEPAPPFKSIRPVASTKSIGRAADLIDEKDSAALSRNRNHSIATPAEAGIRVNPNRRGSGSDTPPQSSSGLLRKASVGNSMPPTAFPAKRNLDVPDMSNGMPKRNRPAGRARNRESLDLDDVMDIEDEISFGPPPMTPKSAAPPATSASTRELIDFLSEGPPELPSLPPLQTNGNDKPAKSGGRLRNMFSRGRQSNDSPPTSSNAAMNGSSSLGRSNSSLKKQRSAGNIAAPRPVVQPFEYPKPPNYAARSSAPPSPTHSSSAIPTPPNETAYSGPNPNPERQRHLSVTRKAVPVWDGGNGTAQNPPVPSPSTHSRTLPESKAPPSPKASTPSSSVAPHGGYPIHVNTSTTQKDSPASATTPPTPSKRAGMIPSARSAGIPNLPAAKAADVTDMRKKLAYATSVAEARLLVDLFLAQWGFPAGGNPLQPESEQAVEKATDDTEDKANASIVEMLLGESTGNFSSPPEENNPNQAVYAGSTGTDVPPTPASARITTSRVNTRDDVKAPSPVASASPSASGSSALGHGSMYHHRYGNGSPVVVG
jgi:hypothetical protein